MTIGAIYEAVFINNFFMVPDQTRAAIQALSKLKMESSSVYQFVSDDIKGCFDNIDQSACLTAKARCTDN